MAHIVGVVRKDHPAGQAFAAASSSVPEIADALLGCFVPALYVGLALCAGRRQGGSSWWLSELQGVILKPEIKGRSKAGLARAWSYLGPSPYPAAAGQGQASVMTWPGAELQACHTGQWPQQLDAGAGNLSHLRSVAPGARPARPPSSVPMSLDLRAPAGGSCGTKLCCHSPCQTREGCWRGFRAAASARQRAAAGPS